MCLEHTVCFSGSWRLFQIVLVPREHCACVSHMSNLSPSVLRCAGVTMYKGEHFPLVAPLEVLTLLSLVGRVSAETCWLAAVSWIPPSIILPTRDFVYIESKVPCFAGRFRFFSSNVPPPLSFPQTYLLLANCGA